MSMMPSAPYLAQWSSRGARSCGFARPYLSGTGHRHAQATVRSRWSLIASDSWKRIEEFFRREPELRSRTLSGMWSSAHAGMGGASCGVMVVDCSRAGAKATSMKRAGRTPWHRERLRSRLHPDGSRAASHGCKRNQEALLPRAALSAPGASWPPQFSIPQGRQRPPLLEGDSHAEGRPTEQHARAVSSRGRGAPQARRQVKRHLSLCRKRAW